MLLAQRSQAFHWGTLTESGGSGEGGAEGQPAARDGGERAEGENIKWTDGG